MPGTPSTARLVDRLLASVEHDVLPLTERAVTAGNKVFGAALLDKADLSTVLAETNNEMDSPLHHGEMHLLKRYHEWPAAHRPSPASMIFLSTHEPCSLCLSAIAWSGFDTVHYLFSHEDSRDRFAIPHDLKILKEVFDCDPGGYRRENAFFTARPLRETIAQLDATDAEAATARVDALDARYAALSERYQASKSDNGIPLA